MPITEGGRFSPVDRIVSPGVFTRENDLSGLAQGVADIGGAIVAPFAKGPGFSPTLVRSVAELEEKFGLADGVYYGPYTAKEYLQEQGQVTVVRVGAITGYRQNNPLMIYAVPGAWARQPVSASVETGSVGNLTPSYVKSLDGSTTVADFVTYDSSSATVTMSATVVMTFENDVNSFHPNTTGSEDYAGATVTLGTITKMLTVSEFYLSSSAQGSATSSSLEKLNQALLESTETTSYLSMSFSEVNVTPSSTFDVQAGTTLRILNPVFKAFRSSGGCGTVLYMVSGALSGSYGPYTGLFTSSSSVSSDPCGVENSGDLPQILAVLANTRNATQNSSDLSLPGFTGSMSTVTASVYDRATSLDFSLKLSSSAGSTFGTYEFSLDPNSSKYITSVFGSDPTIGDPDMQVSGQKIEAAYLYRIFEDTIASVKANKSKWQIKIGNSVEGQTRVGEVMNFSDAASLTPSTADSSFALKQAETPWVTSQTVAPWKGAAGDAIPSKYNLFKLHTLGDGTGENTRFKVEISNVKLAGTVPGSDYGSFTLSIRSFSDTEKRPKILETFQNLNLDPDSANFIARRIGDRYNYITFAGKIIEFGTYATLSKYVRVESGTDIYPAAAVPYGFRAYATPVDSNYSNFITSMKYSKASTYSQSPGRYASGVMFGEVPVGSDDELTSLYPTASTGVGCGRDNSQYFAPLPAFGSNDSNGENTDFDLEDNYTTAGVTSPPISTTTNGVTTTVTGSNSVPSYYIAASESANVKKRKFVFGFQGGFDGQWPATPVNIGANIIPGNSQGLDCTSIVSAGSIAYKQCIGALGNADEFDINLIVTPGIFSSMHSYITNLVVDMCEARGDCFYIMDNVVFPNSNQSTGLIDAAVAQAAMYDTNYAATYYPWVKILDTNLNKIISVPPSVVLPAIFAANDSAAAEWFAPAGLNRGGITQAVQVLDRLTHQERDTLYEGRVNPIAAFPGQGICVWGQKTLQVAPSALDRINVRRLLIALKKFIASSSKFLVFEQNVASTRNKFLAIVNPYLESVQQRSGLYAFQVKMDESNNTPDLVDRNILYGQIYIQPAKTAEYIILDFNILPTGAAFPGA